MKTSSAKAKGRRLQVEFAEAVAVRFHLTVEASPPTRTGTRPNGAVYVAETENADLRVRRSGEPGNDVVPLTTKARHVFHIFGWPFAVECKNVETLSFDRPSFWKGQGLTLVDTALQQALRYRTDEMAIVIMSRNQFPVLVAFTAPNHVEHTYLSDVLRVVLGPRPILIWNRGPRSVSEFGVIVTLEEFLDLIEVTKGERRSTS